MTNKKNGHAKPKNDGAIRVGEEAEQVLIASVLRDNGTFEDISDMVLPEHFSSEKHQYAWAAVSNLIARGTRADAITILPHIHVAPDEDCKEPPHAEYFSKKIRLLHRPRGELKGYAEAVVAAHEGRTLTGLFYKHQEAAINGEAGTLERFMAEATELHTGKPAETYRTHQGRCDDCYRQVYGEKSEGAWSHYRHQHRL